MWARPKSCRPKADAYRSHNILFFIWLANTLYVHFVPPGNLLGICNFIPRLKKCSEKCPSPSDFFLHDKHVQTVFGTCFAFLLGIFNSNLCVPASPSPWQINPFLNMDSSPYSLAAPPSPVGCLPTAPTVGGWQRAR